MAPPPKPRPIVITRHGTMPLHSSPSLSSLLLMLLYKPMSQNGQLWNHLILFISIGDGNRLGAHQFSETPVCQADANLLLKPTARLAVLACALWLKILLKSVGTKEWMKTRKEWDHQISPNHLDTVFHALQSCSFHIFRHHTPVKLQRFVSRVSRVNPFTVLAEEVWPAEASASFWLTWRRHSFSGFFWKIATVWRL